jgi:hypothetical protein
MEQSQSYPFGITLRHRGVRLRIQLDTLPGAWELKDIVESMKILMLKIEHVLQLDTSETSSQDG